MLSSRKLLILINFPNCYFQFDLSQIKVKGDGVIAKRTEQKIWISSLLKGNNKAYFRKEGEKTWRIEGIAC